MRTTRKRIGLILAAALPALLAASAGAQEEPAAALEAPAPTPEAWTVWAAAEAAVAAHPSLGMARARQREADAALAEAEATSGLVARWQTTIVQNRAPMLVSPIHSFGPGQIPPLDETLIQSTLSGSYPLWDAGLRRERVAQATAFAQGVMAGGELAEAQVAARVATVFANVLARRSTLDAMAARVTAVAQEGERVKALLDAGKAPEVDLLRAEAGHAGAEAEAARAAIALDGAERELARLLGVEPAAAAAARLVPLAESTTAVFDRQDLYRRARERSPELEQLRRQVLAAEASRRLARVAYYPDLRANAALQEFASDALDFQTEWYVGLAVTVPLWDGGLTRQRVARADAVGQELGERLRLAELDLETAVDRALAAGDEARARAGALERAVERMVEVVRVQKLLVEVGSGTQVDYLQAEAELASSRAALYEARAAAQIARVELARVMGELDVAWLRRTFQDGCACAADDQGADDQGQMDGEMDGEEPEEQEP
jgi:outer membrane protein